MKRPLLLGAGVVAAAVLTRRCARGRVGFDFERMIERMPENAPPKWMFRNISAIRADTERILELLETRHSLIDEQLIRSGSDGSRER